MDFFSLKDSYVLRETPMQSQFPPHIHATYEIFFFISGCAEYSVEGNIYPLSPGDMLILNNMETHHLILKRRLPYARYTVHFSLHPELTEKFAMHLMAPFRERPLGYYNLYQAKQFPDNHWLYYLQTIVQTDDPLKKQIYLLTLLQELDDFFPTVKNHSSVYLTDNILNVTRYIENHIAESITLDRLCDHFFISKSQLNRNFKKNLGTTVGDYILTKRLMKAQNMIEQGQKPTSIYSQCGFNEYSVFYKAYKKKFGYAPSEKQKR